MDLRIILIACTLISCLAGIGAIDNDGIFRGERVLHHPDLVKLSWESDVTNNRVTFHLRAKTESWLGLGLSKTGRAGDYEWHFGWTLEEKPEEEKVTKNNFFVSLKILDYYKIQLYTQIS